MDLSGADRVTKAAARDLLERSVGEGATFRRHQWAAIDGLVNDGDRLLLVQRTGWGKSTVYFVATKLLRERGAGPTLVVSPLLALMHNQIQDAEDQLDLDARTINSENTDEWDEVAAAVRDGDCDLLLISPERLANPQFQQEVLSEMAEAFGLLVVDEAHCISDWGHDFRPDYRRIRRILRELPDSLPVAATTATANDRVVDDVIDQVPALRVLRGDLVRESLRLQTVELDSKADRLAWLAENLPSMPGSGIVYCLTREDVDLVTTWLGRRGFDVEPYHGRVDAEDRREREQLLLDDEVDALVATNALGMGFNKPDLGWVVHFQRPPNLIRYYQEIGRAGRALDEAHAVVLAGEEDDDVAEYFIESAFPEQASFETILETIADSDEPLYRYEILQRANVPYSAVGTCLDILRVDNAIVRVGDGYERTEKAWRYDHDRFGAITAQRWSELEEIQRFVATEDCLTKFVDDALDGNLDGPCGHCANCEAPVFPSAPRDDALVEAAVAHFDDGAWSELSARTYEPRRGEARTKIDDERAPADGRYLCTYGDPGLGSRVADQHEAGDGFDDQVVDAAVAHVREWDPDPAPEWVTAVPSWEGDDAVADLARRIAAGLDIPAERGLVQTRPTAARDRMANAYQQRWNVEGAFATTETVRAGPALLVDATASSRWTMMEAGMTLRESGVEAVYPFALAERR